MLNTQLPKRSCALAGALREVASALYERRLAGVRLRLFDRHAGGVNFLVSVLHRQHLPAERLVSFADALGERQREERDGGEVRRQG